MKNTMKKISLLFALFAMTACASGSGTSTNSNSVNSSGFTPTIGTTKELRNPGQLSHEYADSALKEADYLAFKNKIQLFSNKLSESYAKRFYADGSNILISPLSIEMCLGLAIRCANGQTRQEILDAIDVDYETFNTYYKLFFNEMMVAVKTYTGDIMAEQFLTNSIWFDNDISLIDSGLDALMNDYYCYSFETDFDKNNKQANKDITGFIKQSTNGLLEPNLNLEPSTLFVLMNTLYLKDIWNEGGYDLSEASNLYRFKNKGGVLSNKKLLMGNYSAGKTLSTDDYSSFYADTKNGFRLYFIKPNEGKEIKDAFTKETLDFVLDTNNYEKVNEDKNEIYETRCIFPEYTIDSDFSLIDMFMNDLHVTSLFNSATCDFSNIINGPTFCGEFKQVAKLEVNKKGIKGAAVTYMAYSAAVGPGPYTEIKQDFLVDKEFGFILTKNNAVTFSGIVTNIDK